MTMTEIEVLQEAERRYHYDAEFHAEVERAVYLALTERTGLIGRGASEDEMAFARICTAAALVLREPDA